MLVAYHQDQNVRKLLNANCKWIVDCGLNLPVMC